MRCAQVSSGWTQMRTDEEGRAEGFQPTTHVELASGQPAPRRGGSGLRDRSGSWRTERLCGLKTGPAQL